MRIFDTLTGLLIITGQEVKERPAAALVVNAAADRRIEERVGCQILESERLGNRVPVSRQRTAHRLKRNTTCCIPHDHGHTPIDVNAVMQQAGLATALLGIEL